MAAAMTSAKARAGFMRQAARNPVRPSLRAAAVASAVREYGTASFTEECKRKFPAGQVANAEEARALWSSLDYKFLDVRPTLEADDQGHIRGVIELPYVNCRWQYDAAANKKTMRKEKNDEFMANIKKRYPDKQTNFLVMCGNGKKYSIDALEMLDDAGYHNLVLLKDGFLAWTSTWDTKLNRRSSPPSLPAYKDVY